MYLKSLTLKGFKSFAQPTTFAFEPGVTAVVGPNGSGKSNVVDALAWVMGEQGAKTLRGGKMEDVIFAGTSTRGPLGRAEVSLTIDNADGALPIEYTEVTISRTLFRNGSSEYAINGESCRLLDVQELLSDSGLGREMHVIVGQGRLDNVLQASAEDRRGFIEEAAGILKHRRRKEKSVRKLEAMETNLTRLSDLAGEIRRQLKPLGRQAEVAREAQSIAATVRDARARILADDVVTLRRTLEDHAKSEQERHTERIVLTEQLEQKSLRIARLEAQPGGEAVDEARQIVHSLESVQERVRGLYTLANQRISLLGTELDIEEQPHTVTKSMIDDAAAEAAASQTRVNQAEDALLAAQSDVRTKRASLDAVDVEVAAQSALVSQHDLDVSALVGRADAAASAVAALAGEVERQSLALTAAETRAAEAQTTLDAISTEAGDESDTSELNAAYEAATEALATAETERDRLRDELHELERNRDAYQAQTRALSRALESNDGTTSILERGTGGAKFRVADAIKVNAGFEAAVTAALGSLADAVLVSSAEQGIDVLAQAHDDELGRVDVVIPVSAAVGGAALLIALAVGVPLGALAALRPNTIEDRTSTLVATLGICTPSMVLGPLIAMLFGLQLRWFNASGWFDSSDWVLPALTLGIIYSAYIARLTRGSLRETLAQEFVRTARAKGASESSVVFFHAMKLTSLPVLNFLGPAAAGLLTGSFIVETVFQLPGLGQFFIAAATNGDHQLTIAISVFYAALIVSFNLIVDILQAMLNPRIRLQA